MNWSAIGLALAALAGLALVARWRRLAESRMSDAATACRFAEEALAGFVARDALVATDGGAALVAGDGVLALLRRNGPRIAARRIAPPLRVLPAVEGVTVFSGDRGFGDVVLFGVTDAEVSALAARAAQAAWLEREPRAR